MKRVLALIVLVVGVAWGQPNKNVIQGPAPSPAGGVAVSSASGSNTVCYMVVTRYTVGNAAPSSPTCSNNLVAPGSSNITISWNAMLGALGYDVIRLPGQSIVSACSNCLVTSNTPSTSATDSTATLVSGYTLTNPVQSVSTEWTMNNRDYSTPVVLLNPSFPIVGGGGGGTGTVTTTGSPSNGNLAKFSGTTSITNGDISGDCTTSGSLAITCTKTNGVTIGTGTVTHSLGNLTALSIMAGNGTADSQVTNITTNAGLNNLSLPGTLSTGVGSGNAGIDGLGPGTQSLVLQPADNFGFIAPASGSGQHFIAVAATPPGTNGMVATYTVETAGISTQSFASLSREFTVGSTITRAVSVVANMPTCSGTNEGMLWGVTDANANTWGTTIAAGGSNHVLAYCDGTNWTIAAK